MRWTGVVVIGLLIAPTTGCDDGGAGIVDATRDVITDVGTPGIDAAPAGQDDGGAVIADAIVDAGRPEPDAAPRALPCDAAPGDPPEHGRSEDTALPLEAPGRWDLPGCEAQLRYYRFSVPPRTAFVVTSATAADIGLVGADGGYEPGWRLDDGRGVEVAGWNDSEAAVERVVLTIAATDLEVRWAQCTVGVSCPGADATCLDRAWTCASCADEDDLFDPRTGRRGSGTPQPLGEDGSARGLLCDGDADWFTLTLPADRALRLRVDDARLDAGAFVADEAAPSVDALAPLGSSVGVAPQERALYVRVQPGADGLRDRGLHYRLEAIVDGCTNTLQCGPWRHCRGRRCVPCEGDDVGPGAADPFVGDGAPSIARGESVSDAICGGSYDWFVVPPDGDRGFVMHVAADPEGPDGGRAPANVWVYRGPVDADDRSALDVVATEFGLAGPTTVVVPDGAPGDAHYIVVGDDTGEPAHYTVTVEPPGACWGDEHCAAGEHCNAEGRCDSTCGGDDRRCVDVRSVCGPDGANCVPCALPDENDVFSTHDDAPTGERFQPLEDGVPVEGVICAYTDADYYIFPVPAGRRVAVDVTFIEPIVHDEIVPLVLHDRTGRRLERADFFAVEAGESVEVRGFRDDTTIEPLVAEQGRAPRLASYQPQRYVITARLLPE